MNMRTEEFSDGAGGYCVTTMDNGEEFILSQQFKEGTHGVGVAVERIVHEMNTIPTMGVRFMMLKRGIEVEQMGMRLTSKAPACSAIVKREYGVRKGLSKRKTGVAFELLLELARMLYKERQEEANEDGK
tara:strand:- start:870 stop:1259 length:390 start_codon:yes stop_codon:yes gene_type:complete